MTIELKISGMTCQHCVGAVTRALESVPGVTGVRVELAGGLARVEGEANPEALVQAVADAGYKAEQSPGG
jgi:copper chaperone